MRQVLFVSIAFPPKNDPECLQTAKYFKYLAADSRVAVSVATSRIPTLNMSYDHNLEHFNTGYQQLISIPVFETKVTNFALRKLLPGGIDYPDSKYSFYLQHRRVIRQLKQKPDVIYSRSFPMSSALMAYRLKKYYQVPWIMHMSDPWVGSPVHAYKGRQLRFNTHWQDACFEAADRIALTSLATIQFYKERYPQYAHKFEFFPNVYDPDDSRPTPVEFNSKLRIVYTGGLAGKRSARVFLDGCSRLYAEDPTVSDQLEIIFAGPLDSENRAVFEQCSLPMVRHAGLLPFHESMKLIRTAHVLLILDLPIADPRMAMFFPSKILDYFLANRRMLALTSSGSSTDQVLRDYKSTVLRYDDADGVKAAIREALDHVKKKNEDYFLLGSIPEMYSAKVNASRLADLITSL